MRAQQDVLVGQLGAFQLGDDVELRHHAQVLRLGLDPEHRYEAVRREPKQQAVVFA